MSRSPDLAVVSFNVAPPGASTAKYDRLGPAAMANHRAWAERHGYPLYDTPPVPDGRPACWGKLTALRAALERHEWALWADSDALVLDLDLSADAFCGTAGDLVTQSMDAVHALAGVDRRTGRERFPVNTGVFLLRSSAWSLDLLHRADARSHQFGRPLTRAGQVWDGFGDQEALTAVLLGRPADLVRIVTVDGLQAHPRLHRPGQDLFVHLYGNHAAHRMAPARAEAVIRRWERALERGLVPHDLPAFHWACIQQDGPDAPFDRGGPERFLYEVDVDGSPKCGVPPSCSE